MGLDMYLTKEYWLSGYKTNLEEITFHYPYANGKDKIIRFNKPIDKIVFEVAYWRKANQIHKWFVDNVQNGTDDCSHYWVDREKLVTLLNLCKQVKALQSENLSQDELEEQINTLLPTQSGFFFGDTQYDDWYFSQIQDTIDKLEAEIESEDFQNQEAQYYYQSSW